MIEALTWALALDPATLKWPAAVLVALGFGLVLFGLVQYQAFNRLWGLHLVLGLAGGAVVAGLGAASHWLLGVLYGVGYALTWLVWVLTRRWRWWRRALARGLTAGVTLGPWLWIGATETEVLLLPRELRRGVLDWEDALPWWPWEDALPWWPMDSMLEPAAWLLTPNGVIWWWVLLGALWLLVLVGGWGCWRWPRPTLPPASAAGGERPSRYRRRMVIAWALLIILGLNWYAAGRVDVFAACGREQTWSMDPAAGGINRRAATAVGERGQTWRLGYVLVSRPGVQWYRNKDGETPLHEAASNGKPKAVRLLRTVGAEIDAKDHGGWTSLHRAASRGKIEALQVLLAARAVVHAKDNGDGTPLHAAASAGQTAAIRVLLAAGANVNAQSSGGSTPLHWAAGNGHADAVRLLLTSGADLHAKDKDGETPLHNAATSSNAEEPIKVLLAAGAEVKAKTKFGRTPLHLAAKRGSAGALRLLLAAGADVNARDNDGLTSMHWAAASGDARALRVLLAAGADVQAKANDGETLLHVAAAYGRLPSLRELIAERDSRRNSPGQNSRNTSSLEEEALRLLLAAGLDPHAKDKDGRTPLHGAAGVGNEEAFRVLLAAGADLHAKDKDGETPLHWAAACVYMGVLRELLAAGARVNERDSEGRTALDIYDALSEELRKAGGKTGKELDAEQAAAPTP